MVSIKIPSKFLYVDDDPDQHVLVKTSLENLGDTQVYCALDEEQALPLVKGFMGGEIDALILDLGLNTMDVMIDGYVHPRSGVHCGMSVIEALRTYHRRYDVPIFVRSKLNPWQWIPYVVAHLGGAFQGYIWKLDPTPWPIEEAIKGYTPSLMVSTPNADVAIKELMQQYFGAGLGNLQKRGGLWSFDDDDAQSYEEGVTLDGCLRPTLNVKREFASYSRRKLEGSGPSDPFISAGRKANVLKRNDALVYLAMKAGWPINNIAPIISVPEGTANEFIKRYKTKYMRASESGETEAPQTRLNVTRFLNRMDELLDTGELIFDVADQWEAKRLLTAAASGIQIAKQKESVESGEEGANFFSPTRVTMKGPFPQDSG